MPIVTAATQDSVVCLSVCTSAMQGQSTFLITNDHELNSWNQTKGYAIVHTGATASQLLPDNHPLVM